MFKLFSFSTLGTIFFLSLMVNTSSAQVIVAAWDTFGNEGGGPPADIPAVDGAITLQPDVSDFSPGSTYSFTGDVLDIRANQRGSNDGTFGSAIEGADNPEANGDHDTLRILQGVVNGLFFPEREMFINITAADDLNFSTFHFDAGNNPNPANGDTYSDVTVSFIGADGVETILPNDSAGGNRSLLMIPGSGGDGTISSATANWLDQDFDVSGLSLASGETGAFRLRFFDTNPLGLTPPPTLAAAVHLDNIAITVAEPADVLGDFDGNGVVDCVDLDGYIGNLNTPAEGMLSALDFDGDGTLTQADADSTVMDLVVTMPNGITGTFPGDFNCDGAVDVLNDAFALVGSLGGSADSYSDGDANFDGIVDVLNDAFTLVGNLGETNEPTAIVLP